MKIEPDIIFTINDMWIVNEQYKQIQDMHKDGRFKFVGYVPMDSYNWVGCLTDTANDWDGIVSYTEFGAREFIKAGIEAYSCDPPWREKVSSIQWTRKKLGKN